MSPLLSIVILAVVQGLTEFLPVSSSGHLEILRAVTGLEGDPVTLEVALHLGTFLAVLFFFRKRILDLLAQAWKGEGKGRAWILAVVVGSIPAGLVGVLFKDWFEQVFQSLLVVAVCLGLTGLGLLLLGGPPKGETRKVPGLFQSLLVGLAQALAILPGISRSGSTIVTGLRTGMDRRTAGEFSFFLSLPAVGGAVLLKALHVGETRNPLGYMAVGVLVSAVVGYLSLGFLMWILEKGRLRLFGPWCLAASALAFYLYLAG